MVKRAPTLSPKAKHFAMAVRAATNASRPAPTLHWLTKSPLTMEAVPGGVVRGLTRSHPPRPPPPGAGRRDAVEASAARRTKVRRIRRNALHACMTNVACHYFEWKRCCTAAGASSPLQPRCGGWRGTAVSPLTQFWSWRATGDKGCCGALSSRLSRLGRRTRQYNVVDLVCMNRGLISH